MLQPSLTDLKISTGHMGGAPQPVNNFIFSHDNFGNSVVALVYLILSYFELKSDHRCTTIREIIIK